jgi:hypothetical protein
MSDSNQNSAGKQPGEFKIKFDSQAGDGLQKGLEALQQVFGGFVQSIKDAVGPEMMRNFEAAQWLGQLGDCLDQIATGLRDAGKVPPEAAGQLAFFVDQWDSGLRGSKLEPNRAALRTRLESAEQAIQQATAENAAQQAAVVAQSAGYFHAAAKSVLPLPTGGKDGK